ncbi:proline iminopeptidase-family hydrolase [Actinoplanes solisilvae]|uniref:proline iminopeptidase-family hydrolase n=1 Tax=Actinoplanes solisilvae TaxID=2486853 RepID=UPI000FD860CC|nr:proline iminopeptidase-family hydrolase [Actinoplanes solisilvae]
MKRRNVLAGGAAALTGAALGGVTAGAAEASPGTSAMNPTDDPLNPPGIRVAGIRMVPVVGGKYKVWTKRIGHGPVKVLLLHGGSGFDSSYLEVMESFLPQAGIEMYYYDQLGCGNSDKPDDKSLWTVERYTNEVEEVRKGLGLDNVVVFGHSWGGMLALEYALKYQKHLSGLVVSNMSASMQSFVKYAAAARAKILSPEELEYVQKVEAAQDFTDERYQHLINDVLYTQIICRTSPWPEPLTRTFNTINVTIYNQIFGENEFVNTGNAKNWDVWDRLHEIRVPTLSVGARFDEMDPADMRRIAALVQNGESVTCNRGSHLAMYDEQEFYFKHLIRFLRARA